MLDIPWLLEQVRAHDRCQSAILELWTPPESTPEKTVATEARWAEESLRYLKPLFALKTVWWLAGAGPRFPPSPSGRRPSSSPSSGGSS